MGLIKPMVTTHSNDLLSSSHLPKQRPPKKTFLKNFFTLAAFTKANSLTRSIIELINIQTDKTHIATITDKLKLIEGSLSVHKTYKDIKIWVKYFTENFSQGNLDHVAARKTLSVALMSPIYTTKGNKLFKDARQKKQFIEKIIKNLTTEKGRGFSSSKEARQLLKENLIHELNNVEFDKKQLKSIVKSVTLRQKRHSLVMLTSLLMFPIMNALKSYEFLKKRLALLNVLGNTAEDNQKIAKSIGENLIFTNTFILVTIGVATLSSTYHTIKAVNLFIKESKKSEGDLDTLALMQKHMTAEFIKLTSISAALISFTAPYLFEIEPLEAELLVVASKSIALICTFTLGK